MALMPRFEPFKAVSASNLNAMSTEIERVASGTFSDAVSNRAPLVRVARVADLLVPTTTTFTVPFDTVGEDTNDMWDPGSPEVIVINTPGLWIITAQIRYSGEDSTNYRFGYVCLNGQDPDINGMTRADIVGRGFQGVAVPLQVARRFAVGDLIYLMGHQNSGSTLNAAPTDFGGTYLSAFWMAP